MKKSPFRISSAFLPGAFILSALFGNVSAVTDVFFHFIFLLLISLSCPGAFRNASAAEPGIRRIDARFLGSSIQLLISSLLSFVIIRFAVSGMSLFSLTCAVCLMFEQLFEERLFSIGRPMDANMLSVTTSILFTAGNLLGYSMYSSIAALVIALIITLVNQPVKFRKPLFSLQYSLRALLQDLVPPALFALSIRFIRMTAVFAFVGWLICRSARTFARCSPDETCRPLFGISILLLLSSVFPLISVSITPAFAIGISAALCTAIDFCFSIRTMISLLLFCATAVLTYLGFFPFAAVTALSACICSFDKHVFLRKV